MKTTALILLTSLTVPVYADRHYNNSHNSWANSSSYSHRNSYQSHNSHYHRVDNRRHRHDNHHTHNNNIWYAVGGVVLGTTLAIMNRSSTTVVQQYPTSDSVALEYERGRLERQRYELEQAKRRAYNCGFNPNYC